MGDPVVEEALRATEERYRSLFEQAADGILVTNASGVVLDVNEAACVLLGYLRDELVGTHASALVHPETMARVVAVRELLPRAGSVNVGEWMMHRKDGELVHVEVTANTLTDGTRRSVFRDMTARKRLELERQQALAQLRASEERYRLFFENASEAIFVFRTEGTPVGAILAANPAATAWTGYTIEELLRMTIDDLNAPEMRAERGARIQHLVDHRRAQITTVWLAKDGSRLDLEFRTGLVQLDGERVALAFGRDIGERLRTEEALRRATEAADAANRAKSAFLATMSHEIRTPMNAILGYAQLLQRDDRLDREQRRAIETIGKSGNHLLELINDVLEMSKIEAGFASLNRGTFDLLAMLDDLDGMFRLRADEKQLTFAVSRSPGVPRFIVTDEGKLRQVLVNILSNATKFTRKGGVAARVAVRAPEEGTPHLLVDIEDTGPGIGPDELASLFQPFVQTRSGRDAGGGTGLGLAISRKYARLLGGDLRVRSRVGEGSVFRLEIPFEEGDQAPTSRRAPRVGRVVGIAGGGAPLRVVVADDQAENRGWLVELLTQVGFEVREASDGAEAVHAFEGWAPHVVLMDLHMPNMDGFAAMRAIRVRPGGETVALVALTASAFDDSRDAIFGAGADSWLRKPCREAQLLDELARLLGISYQHLALRAQAPTPVLGMEAIRPAAHRRLPSETIAALRSASRMADYQGLCDQIQALPAEHAGIGAELLALVESFSYERLEVVLSTMA